MGAKNLENRAPTPQNRAQKAPRGGLGGLLGRLVATLKTKLAPSSVWEASWGGLGGLLGRLDAKLRAKYDSKLGPKREVFGIQKRSENECIIGSLLGSTF